MVFLLGSQPVLAQADASTGVEPRWYVGAEAGKQIRTYSIDRQGFGQFTSSLGAQGAYAVSPRLLVQVGVQYGRGNKPNEELQGSGSFAHYPQTEQITRSWTVPVQLRWSLAKDPHRFRLESIAGIGLCFFRQRETGTNTATATKFVKTNSGTNGYLDAGIGGRLRLNPQFDLTADLLLNVNMARPNNSYFPIAPGFGSGLSLQYKFR
ncbi:outer membrane beta-barrel protein [Hymenobacter daecheongensis]|uniref:outer membrane beta-barrel protein n=1 Tax=Hymenobacter daecheongensis TaxID=496053 RepID=UPI00135640FB|nr:outer membrane beta-barrel protein [Hymenobacter daecheongensis]